MRPPRRPRRLTAGEAQLWGEIAKLVTPLRARATKPAADAPPAPVHTAAMPDLPAPILKPSAPPSLKPPGPKPPSPKKHPPRPPTDLARPASAAPYQAPAQRPAASHGIEPPAKLALRRGRLAIEARIDLHGMVQAEAHFALTAFILRARAAGHAYVLVVTGKGGTGYGEAFAERGVLRRSVPHWLRGPELRGIVIGFEEAARHHGGAGALYVRLRRR